MNRVEQIKEELRNMEGGLWTADRVAEHLGMEVAEVPALEARGQVFSVEGKYPAWQFLRGHMLKGLFGVLKALGDVDEWTAMQFFLLPNTMLPDEFEEGPYVSPLIMLRRYSAIFESCFYYPVIDAAKAHNTHGAI